MKIKIFSTIVFLFGIFSLFIKNIVPEWILKIYADAKGISLLSDTNSITIKFFITNWSYLFLCLGCALIMTAMFCFLFTQTVKNTCTLATSAISIGLSAIGGMGVYCVLVWFSTVAFGEQHKYPITYPTSIILGMFCFFLFIVLAVIYFYIKQKKQSLKGFVIDILTSIIYLPTFFAHSRFFINWLICKGRKTLYFVFLTYEYKKQNMFL